MAKLTLLDMVQNILNAMDSDEVNSIDDTTESLQVATIIQETYSELMASRDWPFLRTQSSFTGLGDTTNPTKMMLPDNINKVFWVKYNKKDVEYLSPKDFRDMIDSREASTTVTSSGYINNRDPVYWTTFDDKYAIFDSWDSVAEDTLTSANCVVYAVVVPTWTHEDAFIPDIPEKVFPTLLAEAKATCFVNLKQQVNNREEMRARRGRVAMQNESWRTNDAEVKSNSNINYGRK